MHREVHRRVARWAVAICFLGLLATGPAASASHPRLTVPPYSSLPGAHAKIYLDFGGTDYVGTWGVRSPGEVPAYDINGDPSSFSTAEIFNIRQIYLRVAEKYSPFNINVTTVDPGNLNNKETARIIIGGDGSWRNSDPAAGVAFVSSFTNSSVNIGWVFPTYTSNGNPKTTAEAAAHEAGHMFGLQHQSTWTLQSDGTYTEQEYSTNGGNTQKRPVMGSSYGSTRGLWWNGTTTSPTTIQNDLTKLVSTTNGFGYRPDDHAGFAAAATPLTADIIGRVGASGIIGQTSDLDLFRFETGTGTIRFSTALAEFGGMLDSTLQLFTSTGTLLQTNATDSLTETLIASLFAGEYLIGVSSRGNFGDIGQYKLTGQLVPVPEPAALALVLFAAAACLRRPRA